MRRAAHQGRGVCRRGAALRDALIGVAVALALALLVLLQLTRGRSEANEAMSLGNLRQIGEATASYAAFKNDRFPFAEAGDPIPLGPRASSPTTSVGEEGRPVWMLETLWFSLVPVGETWAEGAEVARSPGGEPLQWPLEGHPDAWGTASSVSYRYSNSFLAAPGAWPAPGAESEGVAEGEASGEGLIRATLVAEVAFPSRKTLYYDADRFYLTGNVTASTPRPVAFVDNSAFARRDEQASDPAPTLADRGEGRWRWPSLRRHHDTPLGVRGMDFGEAGG